MGKEECINTSQESARKIQHSACSRIFNAMALAQGACRKRKDPETQASLLLPVHHTTALLAGDACDVNRNSWNHVWERGAMPNMPMVMELGVRRSHLPTY